MQEKLKVVNGKVDISPFFKDPSKVQVIWNEKEEEVVIKKSKRAVEILREMEWGETGKKIKDLTEKEIDETCKKIRYGDDSE
jgi:hypothetical protein